jgi:hypothetical protein
MAAGVRAIVAKAPILGKAGHLGQHAKRPVRLIGNGAVPVVQLGHVLALHIDRAKHANDVLDAGLDVEAVFGLPRRIAVLQNVSLKEPPAKGPDAWCTAMLGDILGGIVALCHRRARLNAAPGQFRHLKSPVSP